MRITQTQIIDCRSDVERIVTANLLEDPPDELVIETGKIWNFFKKKFHVKMEHSHWNWENKLHYEYKTNSAFKIFALEYEQSLQGLILLDFGGRHVSHLSGRNVKPIVVYIEYVETAPWNVAAIVKQRHFKYTGVRMLQAAVDFSISMGYNGRIGLHSLLSAEPFYEDTMQMTRISQERSTEGLTRFELPQKDVQQFLEKYR